MVGFRTCKEQGVLDEYLSQARERCGAPKESPSKSLEKSGTEMVAYGGAHKAQTWSLK